jgi:pantoate kinase
MPVSEAISPAGISSFFEICDKDANGAALTDPSKIGARGGGFALKRGVKSRVQTRTSMKTKISIRINSRPAPEANTTRWAIERLLEKAKTPLDVRVEVQTSVPIASGFGSSAAGTAASCLALANAESLPVTFTELGRITHVAEVLNQTGLGTAAALFVGGFVLVTEPGAPGVGSVDRLLFPKDHVVLCVYFGPMPTRETLSTLDLASKINPAARTAMNEILSNPNLHTFLNAARKFSREAGFDTSRVTKVIDSLLLAGAVGAAQNMIGDAVHAVVESGGADRIARHVKTKFPSARVFISELDERGVRLS